MITGWGAHHIDSAHWGMDTEYTGPVEIWGTAEFPTQGLWNVHGAFRTEALYANGVHMIVSGDFPNGIKFIGTKGWIFVSRGNEQVTASDPVAKLKDATALASSDPAIITSVIGPDEIHLYESSQHHGNWLECVSSRRQPIAPVEVAHRACSACLLHHIAMRAKRSSTGIRSASGSRTTTPRTSCCRVRSVRPTSSRRPARSAVGAGRGGDPIRSRRSARSTRAARSARRSAPAR